MPESHQSASVSVNQNQVADEDDDLSSVNGSSQSDSSDGSRDQSDGSAWTSESECDDVDGFAEADSDAFDVETGKFDKKRDRAISKERMSRTRSKSRSSSTKVLPVTHSQATWRTRAASIYRKTHKNLGRKPTRKTKSLLVALIFVILYYWMFVFNSGYSEGNSVFSASGKGIQGGRGGHAQAGMMLVKMAKDLHEQVLTDCRDHNQVATMSTVAEQVVGIHIARIEALLKGRITGLSKLFKENTLVIHALEDLKGTVEKDLEGLIASVHTDLLNVQTGFRTIVESNSRDLNESIDGVYDGLVNVLSVLELT